MKKSFLLVLLSLPLFYLLFQGCVETISDPPDRLAPRLDVWSPASDDTVKNGRNYISYYAEDDKGINYCEVYVNGVLNYKFDADSTFTLPKIYFWIEESRINSKISYFVKVYDLWGNATTSTEMNNILVVENTSPPDKPEDFSIQNISDQILKLTWEDVSDNEQGFEIWRKTGNLYELFKTVQKNSVSAYDSTLSAGSVYYYKVRSINKFGKSAFTSEINSAGIGPLSAPANLSGVALGTNNIKLSWQDKSTQEIKFKIERKNSDAASFSHLAYVDSNKTEYTDRYSMYAGGSYSYRIAAQNKEGDLSDWSNQIEVVTLSENISTPSNLEAKLLTTKRRVILTWYDANFTSIEAKIERKPFNGSYVQIGSVPASNKKFEDSLVTMGNYYSYRVRIVTDQGNYSLYSNEASIAVPVMPPNSPGDLKLSQLTPTLFNLKWTDNSNDESGFQLWRSDGNVTDFRPLMVLGPNFTSINDEVLNSNIVYYYKIRAFRDTVVSDFSNLINSTGGSGEYPMPGDFAAVGICRGQIKLTWKDNTTDELAFSIERKTSWGTYSQIALLAPNSKEYIDTGLTPGIEYLYRIKVFNSTKESDWSETSVMVPSDGDCGG